MNRRTILLAAIAQESHSFNPILTLRDAFDIRLGIEAEKKFRGTNSVLGGAMDAAEQAGFAVRVPAAFTSSAAGYVDHAVYEEFKNIVLQAVREGGYAAVVIALHGAMVTDKMQDPEGDLLRAIRTVIGDAVPLTAGMDLHAHVTPQTVAPCDFLTAYKTNPHCDQGATGRLAFEAAHRMLDQEFRPVCASVHFPMLTLGQDRTDEEPLLSLHDMARAMAVEQGLFDISIFNVQQFLDLPHMGQTILAYSDGDPAKALAAADTIARRLWDVREQTIGSYPTLDDCLARAALPGRERPMVLGDQGDRVAAGGPGDSTYVLQTLLRSFPELKSALPIRDKVSVDACRGKAVGDTVTLSVGGRYSREHPPVAITGRLLAFGESARVVMRGPAGRGTTTETGPYAVVQAGQVSIALSAFPLTFLDPNYYEAMGVQTGEQQVLVARSGYHYSANYADIGECVTVGTPGMTAYEPERQPFTVARPFYPVDDISYQPVRALRERAAP
jgi:microcystin degradation protein MlrC